MSVRDARRPTQAGEHAEPGIAFLTVVHWWAERETTRRRRAGSRGTRKNDLTPVYCSATAGREAIPRLDDCAHCCCPNPPPRYIAVHESNCKGSCHSYRTLNETHWRSLGELRIAGSAERPRVEHSVPHALRPLTFGKAFEGFLRLLHSRHCRPSPLRGQEKSRVPLSLPSERTCVGRRDVARPQRWTPGRELRLGALVRTRSDAAAAVVTCAETNGEEHV